MVTASGLIERWKTSQGERVINYILAGSSGNDDEFRNELIRMLGDLQDANLLSEAGTIDLRGIFLSKVHFENINLNKADLSFSNIRDCTFTNCDCSFWELEYGELYNCNFNNTSVHSLGCYHSLVTSCAFEQTYFTLGFNDCIISNSTFRKSKVRLGGVHSKFTNVKIDECEIYSSRTNNTHYSNVSFSNSSEIVLHAPSCSFEGVDFSGIKFRRTNFDKSHFYRSNLQRVFIIDSYLHDCEFNECDLRNAKFENVTLTNSRPVKYINNREDNFTVTNNK